MISFLTSFPEWQIFAILFFLCIGVLPIGRLLIEGRSYNISYASAYGDIALILMALIAKEILYQHPAPEWLSSHLYQRVAFWICVFAGIVSDAVAVKTGRGWGTLMDFYHNIVVVPLLLYMLATAIPLIFTQGTWSDRGYTFLLAGIWIWTFIADALTGRLQQPEYLETHQITQV